MTKTNYYKLIHIGRIENIIQFIQLLFLLNSEIYERNSRVLVVSWRHFQN